MSNSSFFSPPPQPQPINSSSSLPMVPPPVAIGNGPGSGLSSTSKSIRRLSSRQNIISRRPSGVLSSSDSSANLFSKETKVVDGVAFTHTANLSKFSFKKTTVTAAKDDISDDSSEPEDLIEEINEGKARNFEFTNNKSLMRVFRAIIFLQMIALICDNPAVQFPPLFDVLCRAPLFYLIRFYSYPFVDAVYLIQKVWKRAILFFISLYHNFPRKFPKINPQLPSHRQLWTR